MRGHPPTLRRASAALVAGAALVAVALGPAAGASAAPAPTPTTTPPAGAQTPAIGPQTPGKVQCALKISDLANVTGMVATDNAVYAVEGGDTADPTDLKLWTINPKTCATSVAGYGLNPVDPEDLAMGTDGAIWVGDVGAGVRGQPNARSWITLEQITLQQPPATPWRMLYPKTGPFDAEAMLLDKDDQPIIFARASGKSAIYKPNKKLVPATTTGLAQLVKVGDFTPVATGTDTPLTAAVGNLVVTGAAKSPDGSKVVIRTFSDAYEYTLGADGDIVKAITTTTPVITPLPNETPGRAITYSSDGKLFLTMSGPSGGKLSLLGYTPYVPQPTTSSNPSADAGAGSDNSGSGASSLLAKLSLSQLTRIVAAVAAVGLVLAIAGIVGIRRARRRRREEEEFDDYDDYDDEPRSRRRGGRGRGDDRGYGRAGYDEYEGYGAGYAESGYGGQSGGYSGQNGYAGYGANGYDANGQAYGGNDYAQTGYGDATAYGQSGYAGQQGYDYGQQGYGGGQEYGGYAGQGDYAGQGYGDYGGQGYGDYGQYGGQQQGGYEDDFDPLDPRRR